MSFSSAICAESKSCGGTGSHITRTDYESILIPRNVRNITRMRKQCVPGPFSSPSNGPGNEATTLSNEGEGATYIARAPSNDCGNDIHTVIITSIAQPPLFSSFHSLPPSLPPSLFPRSNSPSPSLRGWVCSGQEAAGVLT